MLLLTDGLANRGVTDHEELARLAYDLRRRGITTSTFGVGTDFDESLLQAMADSGGGHFYFIGDVAQMRDHITSEVGETLEVVAREVVLDLTLPESVRVDPLSPFRVEQSPGRARVYLGDMLSGQVLSVVLRVTFDFGEVGREVGVVVRVVDRDRAFETAMPAPEPVTLAWRYADHAANDAQPRDRDVDRVVARMFAERARQEAVQPQPRGPVRRGGRPPREGPGPDRGVRGERPRASRDRREPAGRGARLRGTDAGDGPQTAPLHGEQLVPDADGGGQVDPAALSSSTRVLAGNGPGLRPGRPTSRTRAGRAATLPPGPATCRAGIQPNALDAGRSRRQDSRVIDC